MRHLVARRKLGRTHSHRVALLNGLATQLFRHKKIRTTLAKAKEARILAERLITKAKHAAAVMSSGAEEKGARAADVHARRIVARHVKDREVLTELFGEIATKVAERHGGYTRIVKLGQRYGDNAEMAVLELVDWNLEQDAGSVKTKAKPRAERKKQPKKEKAAAANA
jgi:large subunit ribosomal protein L17